MVPREVDVLFTRTLLLLALLVPVAHATPDIQHWTTTAGTDVYFVSAGELPILDVRVVFDAGSARDGDNPGVADMTLGMLADGAAGMSSNEISTAFESIGANYNVSIDRDMASVQLRTLSKKATRDAALDTLAKVISRPEFPQDDFKREQQRTLIGIRSKLQSPGALASDALPAGKPLPDLPAVDDTDTKQVTIDFPSSQTHVLIGMPVIQRHDDDYFALYVGNHVLGGSGMVSRLFDSIREEQGLSYSVYSYFYPLHQKGPFVAGLQTSTQQAEAALELLRQEIRDYIKDGPTPEELKASKQNITGGFPLRIDSNSDIVGYLAMIGFYELPLDYLDTFNDKVMAVSREDIAEAFQRRLDVDDFVTVLVGKQQEQQAGAAQ